MQLRSYQQEAIDCVEDPFNGILVLPTGSGKSVVIAGLAKKYNEPILILQPSKEILEQNYSKIVSFVEEPDEVGIFSASLNRKVIKRITLATIGSIKNKEDFSQFKIVIIDECQNLNFHELDSIITRVGQDSKIVFCGDAAQTDLLKNNERTGILDFQRIIQNMDEFALVEFGIDDIVRSGLVRSYLISKINLGL